MPASAAPDRTRRWWILAVLGFAQLMVVLDVTIVNIALPSAQKALGFSDDSRQWIITAYALTFGSLLLIGGRIGDLFGRRRVFVSGLNEEEANEMFHSDDEEAVELLRDHIAALTAKARKLEEEA